MLSPFQQSANGKRSIATLAATYGAARAADAAGHGAAAGEATLAVMQGSDMNFYAYTTREVEAGEELTLPSPHPAARPDQALFHYGFLQGGVGAAEPKLAALDLPDGTLHNTPIFSEEDYRAAPPPPCMTGPPFFTEGPSESVPARCKKCSRWLLWTCPPAPCMTAHLLGGALLCTT